MSCGAVGSSGRPINKPSHCFGFEVMLVALRRSSGLAANAGRLDEIDKVVAVLDLPDYDLDLRLGNTSNFTRDLSESGFHRLEAVRHEQGYEVETASGLSRKVASRRVEKCLGQ